MDSKRKPRARVAATDVREACVEAAHAVIAEHGVEHLSLRDVARRLGVSHQAPYKHYPTRDHLLAEVMRRAFRRFAAALDARERSADPRDDMAGLGAAYLRFAREHPLEYRLMFGTPWPESAGDEALLRDGRHAFDILRQALRRRHAGRRGADALADLDAFFVWSAMHGLATILESDALAKLDFPASLREAVSRHAMARVDEALEARAPAARARRRRPARLP